METTPRGCKRGTDSGQEVNNSFFAQVFFK
jgi:hypothetical protein